MTDVSRHVLAISNALHVALNGDVPETMIVEAKAALDNLAEQYDDLWQQMEHPFDKAHRLILFTKRERMDLHHALRVFAKYPGLPDDEKARYTALADELWEHHAEQVANV